MICSTRHIAVSNNLGLRGRLLETGLELPDDLTEQEWRAAGVMLGKVERSVGWWIGDWWAFGESRYGVRKAIVEADDWEGPDYKTCANAATVCRQFETSRRRELLSFTHHAEVTGLPPDKADALLDWAEEPIAEVGRPHSIRELRDRVDILCTSRPRGSFGTGNNEWYTPAEYVDVARRVLGEIDLDPASHPVAQQTIRAASFYTLADDGLTKPWRGRVWLNPPYAKTEITLFVEKLIAEVESKNVTAAIMLTNNYTETAWFQLALMACNALCLTRGRIRFIDSTDSPGPEPIRGQAFFYFGPRVRCFSDEFASIGVVVGRVAG